MKKSLRNTHFHHLAISCVLSLFILLFSTTAFSTAYTVTSVNDVGTGAGTSGDLRYCITTANADATVPHTITFTGAGIGQITLTSNLPAILKQTIINGGTTGTVIINGNGLGAITSGFLINTVASSGSIIENLVIRNITGGAGIVIASPATAVQVLNCWIGLDQAGNPSPNLTGIKITGPVVAGPVAGHIITGNCISKNGPTGILPNGIGIYIDQNSTGNTIKKNRIGTNAVNFPFGNSSHGIYIGAGCNNTIIGGVHATEGNIITANGGSGIYITTSSNHIIKGNYIGIDGLGTVSVAGPPFFNDGDGIHIENNAKNIIIGSTVAGEGNVISGNRIHGIYVLNGSDNAIIEGNYLGLTADGLTGGPSYGNISQNMEINNSDNTKINKNISCSSLNSGIYLSGSDFNIVTANICGLNKTQTAAYGNGWDGIGLDNSSNYNMIGGTLPADGNICCAGNTNIASGIAIKSGAAISPSTFNKILNNYCGLNASGTAFGNQNFGIYLGYLNASNNIVGTVAAPNIVANNKTGGIWLENGGTLSNSIRGNSIYCNGTTTTKGINLNGVANHFPTNPAPALSGNAITSTMSGRVAAGDTIDLYTLDGCNPCTFPQGKVYIGTAIADASGKWTYVIPAVLGISDLLTVTATNTQKLTGSTSEFSTCTTLPVRLLSFNAILSPDNIVLLNWTTASEENNDYFLIQRSTDGQHFETIGSVNGHGNSNQILNYSFTDANALDGISYYRLKQVDYDGASSISSIRSVNRTNTEYSVTIYPNPAQSGSSMNVLVTGIDGEEPVTITVFNAIGQSVYTLSGTDSEYIITNAQFAAGAYLFSIRCGNNSIVQKVIMY